MSVNGTETRRIGLTARLGRVAQGAIVAAGAGVFGSMGFAKARVEDILAAANVSRRTFYKYFQSKEDVLAAIYEMAATELLHAIDDDAARAKDPMGAIRRGLDVYLDYHVENATLLKVLVEQAMRSDSPLFPLRKRLRADITQRLEAAAAKKHDPLLYSALLSMLEGISLELLAQGAGKKEVARARAVLHLFVERMLM